MARPLASSSVAAPSSPYTKYKVQQNGLPLEIHISAIASAMVNVLTSFSVCSSPVNLYQLMKHAPVPLFGVNWSCDRIASKGDRINPFPQACWTVRIESLMTSNTHLSSMRDFIIPVVRCFANDYFGSQLMVETSLGCWVL
jgi:hypothetical protein